MKYQDKLLTYMDKTSSTHENSYANYDVYIFFISSKVNSTMHLNVHTSDTFKHHLQMEITINS